MKPLAFVAEIPDSATGLQVQGLRVAMQDETGLIGIGTLLPVRALTDEDVCAAFVALIQGGRIAEPVPVPGTEEVTWRRLEHLKFTLVAAPQPTGNGRRILLPGEG